MANSNRPLLALRALASRIRFTIVLAGPLSLCCALSVVVHAAPITFRFDATVTGVFPGHQFKFPLDLQVGDVIHGKLTFDPTLGSRFGDNAFDSNQQLPLEFNINESIVSSSQYGIRVINDSPIFDSELPVDVVDDMVLSCSPSSARECRPTLISLPGSEPFRMSAQLILAGAASIFDTPHVSTDPSIWNAFLFERTLRLTFDDLNSGSALLDSSVGEFSLVPEPTAFVMSVLFATFWTLYALRTRDSYGS